MDNQRYSGSFSKRGSGARWFYFDGDLNPVRLN